VVEQGESIGQPEIGQQPRGQNGRAANAQQIGARANQPNLPEVAAGRIGRRRAKRDCYSSRNAVITLTRIALRAGR
jgi:hypothetical protein